MVFNFSRQPVGEHIAKAYCILTIELSVLDQVLELGKCLHEGIRKQIASFLLPGSRSTLGIILPQPLLFSQFLGSGSGGARCGEGGFRPACVVIGSEVCLTSWFHRDPLTAFLAFLTLPQSLHPGDVGKGADMSDSFPTEPALWGLYWCPGLVSEIR